MAPKEKKEAKGEMTHVTNRASGMSKPSGQVPLSSVQSWHGTMMVTRPGRGFSRAELAAAGIPIQLAGRWGLQLDIRRHGAQDVNVEALRGWISAQAPRAKRAGEVKKMEAEVVKLEKEVVQEVEKEATKAKKAVRKAEKEVAAAVEKPLKNRQRKKSTKEKKS